jgi:hypothetical protein
MAAAADQAHAILRADEHHPVTIVLDFMNLVGRCGHLVRFGGSESAYGIVLQHSNP